MIRFVGNLSHRLVKGNLAFLFWSALSADGFCPPGYRVNHKLVHLSQQCNDISSFVFPGAGLQVHHLSLRLQDEWDLLLSSALHREHTETLAYF